MHKRGRPSGRPLLFTGLDLNQFIFLAANAQLHSMVNAAHPVGFRMVVLKVVMVHMGLFTQAAVCNHGLGVDRIGAGNIQSNRVKGCKHTHIRNNGYVILTVAVAERRNVANKADMEMGTVFHWTHPLQASLHPQDKCRYNGRNRHRNYDQ